MKAVDAERKIGKKRGRKPVPPELRGCILCEGFHFVFYDSGRDARVVLNGLFTECGWNVEQMAARLVGESLGISAKQWMIQTRAVCVCRLLQEGWKVSAVARELGFDAEANFRLEFKKVVGVSPSRLVARFHKEGMHPATR